MWLYEFTLIVAADITLVLHKALRDRLVCGLRNDTTQKRLLSEADLTLAKAVQIASSMESAEKQCLQFQVTRPGAICQL